MRNLFRAILDLVRNTVGLSHQMLISISAIFLTFYAVFVVFNYPNTVLYVGMTIMFLGAWIPLLLAIGWKMGYLDHLFFEIETDNIGFADSGESNVFVYANTPGHVLRWQKEVDGIVVNDYVLVEESEPDQSEREKTLIQRTWGLYWIGPKFLNRSVHMIPLTKKKASSQLRKDMPVEEWVVGSDEVVYVNQLRRQFPRPVRVVDMKFNDGIEANLLVLSNYEVVVPRRAVYTLKGDFFSLLELYTMTAMKDVAGKMGSKQFRISGQVEDSQLSKDVVALINKILIRECGIRIKGASIPVYNLSSEEEEKAAKALELAKQQGEAKVEEARQKASAALITAENAAAIKVIDATAEAQADNLRNAASVTDFTLAAQASVALGAHPDIAVQASASVARATRYTHPDSPVGTQVEGSGGIIAIPPVERKVVLTDK